MARITIPPAFKELKDKHRYNIYYGGRGAGRTWSIARFLIIESLKSNILILCTREYQRSIRNSVYAVLVDQIENLGLSEYFIIHNNEIHSKNGSKFIFSGLRINIDEIKSTERVDVCWVEEAQNTSNASWEILIPTIRKDGSYFIISMNTGSKKDATYERFIANPPYDSIVKLLTYKDNPFFPETLKKEMEYCKSIDREKYEHIWLGKPREISNSIVFAGRYTVQDVEVPTTNTKYYYGMDFGFSTDPTVIVECAIHDRTLYITRESYGQHVEIDKLPALAIKMAGYNRVIADNSRPETISYMDKRHVNIRGCKKGKGSVESGVEFIKSLEVIIHPGCINTIYEFENYSYDVDKTTGNPLPSLKKGNDHCIDAIRYAIQDLIINDNNILKSSKYGLF